MRDTVFINQSVRTPLGKTQVTSIELTFVGFEKEDVLDRIDGFILAITTSVKRFDFTDIKHWITDYNVEEGVN
ncbi:hypothetical protein [Bacillus phage SWEP1]|nr:hypothetical protein [Bacillus phage SWEP1]